MVVKDRNPTMPGNQHFTRIDILEIKLQLVKKLGSLKVEKYFGLLDRFFGQKLGRSEFSKLCITIIGRDNIGLHNHLIRSILKNASLAKNPPRRRYKLERDVIDKIEKERQKNCLKSRCKEALPPSPRRVRTPFAHDHKSKDNPSNPLGPGGEPDAVVCNKDLDQKTIEQQSATELHSLGSRPVEVVSVEDGEEVDQSAISPGTYSRSPVTPPLGIPWNGKGNRKLLSSLSPLTVHEETCRGKGELPDTSSLRKRLEQKLEKEGLSISLDCVNLLNSSLDVFLKRLTKPALEMARSRLGNSKERNKVINQATPGRNGVWSPRHSQMLPPTAIIASMLDFRTTMELNPQILGVDWPLQLEKVCLREYENHDHKRI